MVDFTGMSGESQLTAIIPVNSASGTLPNLAWVIGYEDFTTFKPTSID